MLAKTIVAGLVVAAGVAFFKPATGMADAMCGAVPLAPCLSGPNQAFVMSGVSNVEHGGDVSCAEAKNIVRGQGFVNVSTSSCKWETYVFTANRGGHRFLVQAFSDGSIASVDLFENTRHQLRPVYNDKSFASLLGW